MAISLVGESGLKIGPSAASHTLILPNYIQANDFIVVHTATQDAESAGPVDTPPGFTRRWDGGHLQPWLPYLTVVGKVAEGNESGAGVPITWGGASYDVVAMAMVFRGVDTATPWDAPEPELFWGGIDPDPTAITTVTDGAAVLTLFSGNHPDGTTYLYHSPGYESDYYQTWEPKAIAGAYRIVPEAGEEKPPRAGWRPVDNHAGITMALRPATN